MNRKQGGGCRQHRGGIASDQQGSQCSATVPPPPQTTGQQGHVIQRDDLRQVLHQFDRWVRKEKQIAKIPADPNPSEDSFSSLAVEELLLYVKEMLLFVGS